VKTNLKIYEINTRVWIRRFDTSDKKARLTDVPDQHWQELAEKGFNLIWLMGIWKTCPSVIEKCCFQEGLITSYKKALKDFSSKDVIGSPYSIDKYEINPELGTTDELKKLKKKLNKMGMKLILDFIPNHFSCDSEVIETNPYIFIEADEEYYNNNKHTFFVPEVWDDKYFAHGRDPFFPAWTDTIQINYFCALARDFMTGILLDLPSVCDGVRCDMAMLILNNVFHNTWIGLMNNYGFQKPDKEFWEMAIGRVKEKFPEFIFIAETYWDLEWDLQQMGFDFTYDKKLTDRLHDAPVYSIIQHLRAEEAYQKKSVRFIENHDEERAITSFGKAKSLAAAVVISTIQGLRFYNEGQFEGKRIKLPVQLGREPIEKPIQEVQDYYEKLLEITSDEIFVEGTWQLLEPLSSFEGNNSHQNFLAWLWTYKADHRLVVVNFTDSIAQCRIKLDVAGYDDIIKMTDLLTNVEYIRSSLEVYHQGLFVELKPYHSHIIAY